MKLDTVVAVIRHNTELGGDLRLAVREFEVLVGSVGESIRSRDQLEATLAGLRAATIPEVSKNSQTIAVSWRAVHSDSVNRLVRRSAFAQEIFVLHKSAATQKEYEALCKSPYAHVNELKGKATVALAWGYIIESEAVLADTALKGRVQKTVDLLLEPYLCPKVSFASSRIRRAKKTTLSLSHDLHIYKAKFFPRMVRALINIFGSNDLLVVDPFCGSGTALLEASLLGLNSRGIDIDPVCQLISRTKVMPFLQAWQTVPVLESALRGRII